MSQPAAPPSEAPLAGPAFNREQINAGKGLMRDIFRRAPQFNFYQFCALLDATRPDVPGLATQNSPAQEPVRFRPIASLGFPGGELARVELDTEDENLPPTIRTTFLGLYGVDARMPWHVLDDIATRRDGHEPLAAFLDIFNHRIVTLYYRIWQKYRYPVTFRAGATDRVSQSLLCLAGLGIGNVAQRTQLPTARFMALLGLGGQRTRPAEGLVAVIKLLLPQASIKVEEFFPVLRHLENPAALGQQPVALRAGSLVLGQTVMDRNSTVRVIISLPASERLRALLPGGRDHHDLLQMLKIYLGYKLDAELTLRISREQLPPLQLGSSPAFLGLTSLLGGENQNTPVDIRLGRYCGLELEQAHDSPARASAIH
ncbi:type VI secretion system baseplate subunit TssG [Silvimonas sp.]|uniref:type VI secretion system baseplate subunit TssG n=1 Tax=Silvimonas sp. TaxID=2650811 RepID=UPI00283E1AC5|nr:type VI secretion system baseplate subunit TssG [Silvimonas sp.]MDR3428729.1 type VI secretion system baseplate subunit TssG [Silvimonas sp.]